MTGPQFEDDVPLSVALLCLVVAILTPFDDLAMRLSSRARRRAAKRAAQESDTAAQVAWLRSLRPHACTEQTCPQHGRQNRGEGYTADWDGSIIAVTPHGRAQVENYPKLAEVLRAHESGALVIPDQRPGT